MERFFILLLALSTFYPLSAQNIKRCGHKEVISKAQQHPDFQEYLLQKEKLAKTFIPNKNDTVIHIPVVVHIIWRTNPENISLQQIQSQIEVLNLDFRKKNPDTTNVQAGFSIADVKFEFELASIDPNGNPTTGITRTQTTTDDICNTNAYFSLVPAWNNRRYLNIWVCDVGDFLLGFAYSPNTPGVSPLEDGVVIGTNYFGTVGNVSAPYNLGRTTSHEVGHYFDLLHPWGNDFNPSCDSDDGIADTPNQGDEIYNCPNSHISCGSADMLSNFMGYIDDRCMGNFTQGQKERMRMTLYTQRDSLQYANRLGLVSIREIEYLKKTEIFPNPSQDQFHFIFSNEINPKQVSYEIYDMTGRKVSFEINPLANGSTVELLNASKGIYFVKLEINEITTTKKLIKQ